MTDPEPPTDPTTPPPIADPPAAPVTARRRWPSRGQGLALVLAFVLGACLCGGLGVVASAIFFHGGGDRGMMHHGPAHPERRHGDLRWNERDRPVPVPGRRGSGFPPPGPPSIEFPSAPASPS